MHNPMPDSGYVLTARARARAWVRKWRVAKE